LAEAVRETKRERKRDRDRERERKKKIEAKKKKTKQNKTLKKNRIIQKIHWKLKDSMRTEIISKKQRHSLCKFWKL